MDEAAAAYRRFQEEEHTRRVLAQISERPCGMTRTRTFEEARERWRAADGRRARAQCARWDDAEERSQNRHVLSLSRIRREEVALMREETRARDAHRDQIREATRWSIRRANEAPPRNPRPPADEECAICLSRLPDDALETPCGHSFCATCLEASVKTSPSCPLCRATLHRAYVEAQGWAYPADNPAPRSLPAVDAAPRRRTSCASARRGPASTTFYALPDSRCAARVAGLLREVVFEREDGTVEARADPPYEVNVGPGDVAVVVGLHLAEGGDPIFVPLRSTSAAVVVELADGGRQETTMQGQLRHIGDFARAQQAAGSHIEGLRDRVSTIRSQADVLRDKLRDLRRSHENARREMTRLGAAHEAAREAAAPRPGASPPCPRPADAPWTAPCTTWTRAPEP
ncbi:hypothetical protein JL722_6964 [Aureococcus anophagefferens]|nr:hypothetical protein JL722_6964 [Aureococcus anophagefferens]